MYATPRHASDRPRNRATTGETVKAGQLHKGLVRPFYTSYLPAADRVGPGTAHLLSHDSTLAWDIAATLRPDAIACEAPGTSRSPIARCVVPSRGTGVEAVKLVYSDLIATIKRGLRRITEPGTNMKDPPGDGHVSEHDGAAADGYLT